jgi:signal transduction histidine kinase
VFASTTHTYDQSELRFAETYAQRIGIALENERLYRLSQKAVVARDEFLSLAAHELRTPLASLQLSAHSLARIASESAPEELATLSERIQRQTGRLGRLVARLLDTCQVDAERPSLDRASVDLTSIVRDVVQAYQETAKRAGCELVVSAGSSLVGQFDPVRIEQVVWNLLDNAVKFGAKKPIVVSVRELNAKAVVSVRDMGMGIPLEDQELVFERYGRAPSARGFGGLGLGLHLAREIVQAHGGTIHLESAPGKGSTFTVELPLTETLQ